VAPTASTIVSGSSAKAVRPVWTGGHVHERALRGVERVLVHLESGTSAHDHVELVRIALLVLGVLRDHAVTDVRPHP
jgi:hypothetical protein